MWANIFMIVRLLLFIGSITYARECNSYERDKAEYYAEKASKELVSKLGGGKNIRVDVNSCSYNLYSKIFKLNIQIRWSGDIFQSNDYRIDGILKLSTDGSEISFVRTYVNKKVKDLEFYKNMGRGVILLAAIAKKTKKHRTHYYEGPKYKVWFINICRNKVRLAINYKDIEGDWVTASWWVFGHYQHSYLIYEGNTLYTASKTLYYYIEDMDGHPIIQGRYRKLDPVYNKYYPMKKHTEPYEYGEIRLKCVQ